MAGGNGTKRLQAWIAIIAPIAILFAAGIGKTVIQLNVLQSTVEQLPAGPEKIERLRVEINGLKDANSQLMSESLWRDKRIVELEHRISELEKRLWLPNGAKSGGR